MINTNYIKVFTGNLFMIQRIIERLKAINIIGIVKDNAESARLAGFGAITYGQQELFVHKDEMDKAVPIIEAVLKN